MDIEHKTVGFELKAIDEKGEGVLRFIRFEQEDKDGDITRPGFIGKQPAILISAHNWRSDYPPLGRGESFEADGATNFRFKLNLADERARTWHSWLKMDKQSGNPLQQVSYGFSPYADGVEKWQKDGRSGRYLKPRPSGEPGAKLHEISFVTVGSGNDQGVLDIKSAPDALTDEEKATGVQVQSLVFPRSKWDSAEAVRSWLSSHGYSTELDSTENSWRARQKPPGDFQRLRSFCINPSRSASSEECRVMAVGGPMKESRGMDGEPPVIEPSAAPYVEGKSEQPPEAEDYTQYPEDRRPPLPVLTKWLRLYRYHLPFLRDIRKRDGKEISPETIAEFTDVVHEVNEVATLLNIKVMTSRLMPNVEEEAARQQWYDSRFRELTTQVNAEADEKLKALQSEAMELERRTRARSAAMRGMFQS